MKNWLNNLNLRAITLNTFREAVRNKIFYLLLFFGIFFAVSSKIIGMLSIGDQLRVIMDSGIAAIGFFTSLIAIFTGINLVFKEIEKKTIYNILSKPINRDSFILGKFLGLALTVLVALAAMMLIFFLFLYVNSGHFSTGLLLHFLLFYLELLILIALSLLFSSFSTPILSSIFTICLYLIGKVTWTFNIFQPMISSRPVRFLTYLVYYLVPNFEKFNIKDQVVLSVAVPWYQVGYAALYGIAYTIFLLLISIMIFRKRQFQ